MSGRPAWVSTRSSTPKNMGFQMTDFPSRVRGRATTPAPRPRPLPMRNMNIALPPSDSKIASGSRNLTPLQRTPHNLTYGTNRPPHRQEVASLLRHIIELTTAVSEKITIDEQNQHQQPGSPTAGLRREDVERIVKRVEQHFESDLSALEKQVNALRKENEELKQQVLSGPGTEPTSQFSLSTMVDSLRVQLQEEKRQRLRCEEQSQRMVETHQRLVETLEQRVRKQDKVIQELTAMSQQGASNASLRLTPRSARLRSPATWYQHQVPNGQQPPADTAVHDLTPQSQIARSSSPENKVPLVPAVDRPSVKTFNAPKPLPIAKAGQDVVDLLLTQARSTLAEVRQKPLNESVSEPQQTTIPTPPLKNLSSHKVDLHSPPKSQPKVELVDPTVGDMNSVQNFLDSISKELDAINTQESIRTAHLETLL